MVIVVKVNVTWNVSNASAAGGGGGEVGVAVGLRTKASPSFLQSVNLNRSILLPHLFTVI